MKKRSREDMIEIFKMLSGRYNINTEDVIELDKGRVLWGHNKKLKRKKLKGDLRGSYFSIRVVRKWNELHTTFVNSRNLNDFKKRYMDVWLMLELIYSKHNEVGICQKPP